MNLNRTIPQYSFLIIIFTICYLNNCTSQTMYDSMLVGTWVNKYNSAIVFSDEGRCQVDSNRELYNNPFELIDDTLRIIQRITSFGKDGERVNRQYNYDCLILSLTDTSLTLLPINRYSKSLLGWNFKKEFVKQEYFIDKEIELKKITFRCWAYSIEIDSNRHVNLRVTEGWSDIPGNTIEPEKQGNFQGFLSEEKYNKLLRILSVSNLEYIEFPNVSMSHIPYRKFIIEYNDKRLDLFSQKVPYIFQSLTNYLFELCNDHNLSRTQVEHVFEK